jgi:DNA-directed RNA polymerase specialized sigma24 family protein
MRLFRSLTWENDVVVDLLISYSNRLDLADDLTVTLSKLDQAVRDNRSVKCSVNNARLPTVWRVSDRLSEADIERLITYYREGTTAKELATEFEIGLTNVKRLLREHGARRKDNPTWAGSD